LFSCKECARAFTRKDNLTHHIKTRHATSPRVPEKRPSPSTAIDQAAEPLPDWLLLTQSASYGNLAYVERFIDLGYDVNVRADDGNTALHCAAKAGQTVVLQVLIQNGAKVDVRNDKGRFPIYEAIIERHLDCVFLLLEAGTSLERSFWEDRRYYKQGEFSKHVVRIGDCKLVEPVLLATPAYLRPTAIQCLLRAAAKMGQVAILRNLLDPTCTGPASGRTILHYAVRQGYTAAVEYLLPLHQEKETLPRLLKLAAKAGHAEICRMLLNDSPGIDFNDALYIATMHHQLPVLDILMSHQDFEISRDDIELRRPMLDALWSNRLGSLDCLIRYFLRIAQPVFWWYNELSRVISVRRLVQHGILNINDQGNRLRESWASSKRIDHWRGTLLHLAAEYDDLRLAEYVFQHESYNPSILERECYWDDACWEDGVKTPLDVAQYRRPGTAIIGLLIAHGANNHNIASQISRLIGQDSAQPPSPNSDSDHEMQDLSDSDTDTDIDTDS
jgi:ankyrin repeat protein